MPDRIAVTGATGFVGRRVVSRLLAEGHEVRILARNAKLVAISGVEVCEWDARSGDATPLLAGCDIVAHLAAYVPKNMADPGEARTCTEVNALGTLTLLESAVNAGVRAFVHFSSANIYVPTDGSVSEDAPAFPAVRAPYYLGSKLLADIYVENARMRSRIKGTILRVSSVYGPGMGVNGLVPTVARRILDGGVIELTDGGRYSSDLVFVDDVVDGAVRAIASQADGIFNIGSGQKSTVLDVARTMARVLGREFSVSTTEVKHFSNHSGFAALNIDRAQRELGYMPRTLAQGLEKYLESL